VTQPLPSPQYPSNLEPGSIVGVGTSETLTHANGTHYGIVSDRSDEYGLPLVIAPSHRTGLIQEESWLGFTDGRAASVFGAPPASRAMTLARARAFLGKRWTDVWPTCADFIVRIQAPAPALSQPSSLAPVVAVAAVAVVAGALMLFINEQAEKKAPRRGRR